MEKNTNDPTLPGTMGQLADIANEASKLGLSYGEYMMRYGYERDREKRAQKRNRNHRER